MVFHGRKLLTVAVEAGKDHTTFESWNAEAFHCWVEAVYGGESLFVLANREPLHHEKGGGGLVTALQPLSDKCEVTWVAHGSGAPLPSFIDERDRPDVPLANPQFRLRCVSLTSDQEQGYYYGFSNEALWPLCHRTAVRPTFREHDFEMDSIANAQFVAALCEEVAILSPVILVQDYHLALTPKMIRARLPWATVVTFWHIPFPNAGVLSTCPWERELLEGLLGSSIVGFQTVDDCQNFLDAVVCVLGASIDREESVVLHGGHRTLVRAYPASVEWPSRWVGHLPPVGDCRSNVRKRLELSAEARLIVGVDRLDYTKGLNHKLLAFERLLLLRPQFRGNVVFAQVAEPSRSRLAAYVACRAHLLQTADRINGRFGTPGYQPVVLLERHADGREVFELLRAGDVCYVGSLDDGMNLVAKEFVSARDDDRGVLVLSEFAGAARQLSAALCINPYAIDDCAKTLADALTMSLGEQATRMRSMRSTIQHWNSYKWAADILRDAASVRAERLSGLGAIPQVTTALA